MVRPGITGYLATAEDPEDFARGVATLLEDDAARAFMGGRARSIAVQEYGLDLHVRRHVELYEAMLSPPAPRATRDDAPAWLDADTERAISSSNGRGPAPPVSAGTRRAP
jgi:hypothetical protein